MSDNQGKMANVNGLRLENVVLHEIKKYNFNDIMHSKLADKTKLPQNTVVKRVPFNSIYNKRQGNNRGKKLAKSYSEFVIVTEATSIRIECKSQNTAGSVDEKIPYIFANCKDGYIEDYIIIIIEGEGFKSGTKEWAIEQADEINTDVGYTKIQVLNLNEFKTWCTTNLITI